MRIRGGACGGARRCAGELLSVHVPVLADEVGGFVRQAFPFIMLDGTAGAGGHARYLLEKCLPADSRYIALD